VSRHRLLHSKNLSQGSDPASLRIQANRKFKQRQTATIGHRQRRPRMSSLLAYQKENRESIPDRRHGWLFLSFCGKTTAASVVPLPPAPSGRVPNESSGTRRKFLISCHSAAMDPLAIGQTASCRSRCPLWQQIPGYGLRSYHLQIKTTNGQF